MAVEFSRRSFLRGMGVMGAGAAASAALAGCSPKGSADKGASKAADEPTTWRTAPAEIASFDEEVSCDVVVAGHGYAGLTACRELAESGARVVLIERQAENTYAPVGNEGAALNATILQQRGVPAIDPVEFFQNYMRITGNYPNQELVMKFAQNSGANMDWYLSGLTEADLATMTTAFFPKTEYQLDELSGIKFWPSVCSFYGECNQTKIHAVNREQAKKAGAEFRFSTEARYVIMEGGKVAGLAATSDKKNIKFNCKAVVIATGGFGANAEMMADLMPDMKNALVEGEELTSMAANNTGRGIQMAYWAGAHLETCPIPGMNMKGLSVPGKMNCLPQAVWIDENGKRFCNEYYPTAEQRGFATVYKTRKTKFAVVDSNFPTYRQYTIPQHAGFSANEENLAALQKSLDKAYAKFKGTYQEEEKKDEGAQHGPVVEVDYIADDTLQGLASQLGFEGDALAAFLKTIEDYNSYCAAGADREFGRDARVLFPVEEGPFYACKFDPVLGETMVTCGGILTDGEQNAVDANYEPIAGLYVSGNDCGRRFGYEYITPIPGMSLGMAICLGRECGKSVARFLGKA